jgi:hypothetical protein
MVGIVISRAAAKQQRLPKFVVSRRGEPAVSESNQQQIPRDATQSVTG